MAKKTRIDRRGTIRSLSSIVRKRQGHKTYHKHAKRAAVWRRLAYIDDVFLTEEVIFSDVVVPHLNRFVNDSVTLSDTANINGEKVVINSQTITDDGGISKQFQQPANADSFSLSDSIGFELGTLSSVFNTGKVNDMLFNAVGFDQEFYTDSITASDAVELNAQNASSDTATISDSVGFSFVVSSIFNSNQLNLSQLNE